MIQRVWRKPGRCEGNGGNCVEVDHTSDPSAVYIRDSKQGEDGISLIFDHNEWRAHLDAVKAGQYDLPDGEVDIQELVAQLSKLSPEQREQLWHRLKDEAALADPVLQEGLRQMRVGQVTEA